MVTVKYTIIIVSFVLLAINISCSGGSSKSLNNEEVTKLWKQNCALCHGNDGRLGVNGAKDLRLSELDIPARVNIITNGKGKMIGFKNSLSQEQIKSLAEFTLTFK